MTIQIFKGVQNQELVSKADYDKLAAECATQNKRMQELVIIINNADNSYCMCGDSMESHVTGGCGSPTGMFDYHYGAWLQSEIETPVSDAALAELKAQQLNEFHLWANNHGLHIAVDAVEQFSANLRAGVKS